jgi:hypothetical protein
MMGILAAAAALARAPARLVHVVNSPLTSLPSIIQNLMVNPNIRKVVAVVLVVKAQAAVPRIGQMMHGLETLILMIQTATVETIGAQTDGKLMTEVEVETTVKLQIIVETLMMPQSLMIPQATTKMDKTVT